MPALLRSCLPLVLSALALHAAGKDPVGSVGAGIGVPYGTIGVNGEVFLGNYVSLNAGVGTCIVDVAYAVGVKVYFVGPEATFRPRVSVYHGTNAVIITNVDNLFTSSSSRDIKEKFEGISMGIGGSWAFGASKRHGLDLDLIYVKNAKFEDRKKELEKRGYSFQSQMIEGNVKLSVGYRFNF